MSILTPEGSIKDPYRNFIALSRYARWLDAENRRETWGETVSRYMDFMYNHLLENFDYHIDPELGAQIEHAIREHEVLPSMRALMTAGPALERSNIAAYNCAYAPIEDVDTLWEALYILMNGTGFGYSVEKRYVEKLPMVPPRLIQPHARMIGVVDSKEGWALAYKTLLHDIFDHGVIPDWDLSAIRPAGSRLKTFGGRASGPGPLNELFSYTVDLAKTAQGRRLTTVEVHDLVCKVASVVVVGGVRRSAMISLSDLDDYEMSLAKSGDWWRTHPHRALANISAVYHDGTTREAFDVEWGNLYLSGSGERGIFNRDAARRQAMNSGRRELDMEYGSNPCNEIILRKYEFCNLTSVIARPGDSLLDLGRKVRLATILGTWQSTLTDFPLLRDRWRQNGEQERLLGVSLNGIYDNAILTGHDPAGMLREDAQEWLREVAVATNERMAEKLGINASAAVTTVKPEGTSSQLVDSASGMHPRHSPYYIRAIRQDSKDPLTRLMIDSGVPNEPDVTSDTNQVFYFPIAAPKGAITREDLTAIEHLDLWLDLQNHWCEHKPSVTVSIRDKEWDDVKEWVWEHLDSLSGVAFLPYSDHVYKQAPYTECTQDMYEEALAAMPEVRWEDLTFYELTDQTEGAQTLACTAAGCEI
ncbi:hypothetical protein FDA94_29075 [Herbidospora galbida]|uniref:B12-dependent ribonucleotide reductase insertion domain-containing protein n=1 Tax=Herbidospora galbida TaxID=2575442 RepID=A0A4U3M6V2_9ACTN|nr:hypothetical protein [Herbidospora galbida]TKK84668.1 hypothetical protein FDA94_29075 [Herbidospora galbida]